MGAAAMSLTHPHRMLKHHLYSLLREEILSFGFPQPKPGQPFQNARADHGRTVNQRAIECASQVCDELDLGIPTLLRFSLAVVSLTRCICTLSPSSCSWLLPLALAHDASGHLHPTDCWSVFCVGICFGNGRWRSGCWPCLLSTQTSRTLNQMCRSTPRCLSSSQLRSTLSSKYQCPASGTRGPDHATLTQTTLSRTHTYTVTHTHTARSLSSFLSPSVDTSNPFSHRQRD